MNQYAAILVEGPDAQKFLQGQLTCDMTLLRVDYSIRGAHCNQKGRVEALYDLFLVESGVLLVTNAAVVQHALEKLQFYARFSKVTLMMISLTNWPNVEATLQKLSRHDQLQAHKAMLHPETLGRYLPQELDLDKQEAVSLTKGCYLGQEVVARLHYLGKLKKELAFTVFNEAVEPTKIVNHPEWGEVEVVDCEGAEALVLRSAS